MIKLYRSSTVEGRVLALAIEAKGIEEFDQVEDASTWGNDEQPIVLMDTGHVIDDPIIALYYLEARYPSPALLPNDPMHASVVMMLTQKIMNNNCENLNDFKRHLKTSTFIAGERSSFADVAVSALSPECEEFWADYRERLQHDWGSWESQLIEI